MNMREVFENYYGGDKRRSVRHPEIYIDFTTQTVWESFEAGYSAAIEAVKAGMPRYFYHPVTGAEIGPCYKLPEDV